jgi:4-hydroxythreonine-4-phosphate dehydrogenase
MTRAPRLALTVGDPAGIGPEVVAAAFAEPSLAALLAGACVYGDVAAVERGGALPGGVERRPFASAAVAPGRPDPAAARGVVEAIRTAARDCLSGARDALVTAPISKELLARGGFDYPGHTELLAEVAGGGPAVMMLVGGKLRTALATIHCALREVPDRITRDGLEQTLAILDRDLRARFGIVAPRIAVCGLNPHAGEGGRFGDEEIRVIRPAVESARARGTDARGPFSADTLFARAIAGEFDCVLAMYHDQALGPLKTHAFGHAVNVTLGLPLVRTSVDHGTAYEIAGRGKADPTSMIEAIRLAAELSSGRRVGGEQQ